MVALVLSLVIGAAVMQMFLSSKTTYRVQDAMSRLQENGRFAVGLLAAESRMAGYMGCGNIEEIDINVIASPAPLDATNPLGAIMGGANRSDEHTSELQSLMSISYAVFCVKKKLINSSTLVFCLKQKTNTLIIRQTH